MPAGAAVAGKRFALSGNFPGWKVLSGGAWAHF